MSKKVYDPTTNKDVDNTANKLNKISVDSLLDSAFGGQKFSKIPSPIDYSAKEFDSGFSQKEIETLPFYNTIDSSQEMLDSRAENQATSEKIGNGIAKAGITFLGATLDNTAGLYAGTLSYLTGGSFVNNPLGQWIDELNENAQEQFPNYYTKEEQEGFNFGANFWFDKVLNGAAYSAASVASMLVPGAGVTALTRNISKSMIKRAANEFGKQSITNARNFNNAANYASRAFKSTIAESGVEARQTKNELVEKLTEQVLERKRQQALESGNYTINPETGQPDVQLTQEDYDEIEQISDAGMNANFWTNVGIVGASNIAMFGNILRNGSSQAFKDLRKRVIQEGGVYKLAEKNKLNTAKLLAKDAASEASQEGGQFISNIAIQDVAQDFYEAKHNSEANTDIIGSLLDATKETFSTKDGLESILIGAIVGGGMTSVRNVTSNLKNKINEQSNKKGGQDKLTKEEALYNILKSESIDDLMGDMKDNARVQHFMNVANQAVVNNDEAAYHAATFNAFKAALYSHLKNGTEDIFIEKLEEVKQMNDAEFKKFFGYGEMAQTLDKNEVIDNYIEQTKKVTDIYKNMDFLYGYQNNYNVIDLIANKLNKDENEIRDYYKDELYDRITQHEYLTDRASQLETEIDELSEGLVTPKLNRKASDTPITKTTEQTKEFLENQKITQKELREKLKKDKKLTKQIKDLLDRSKTRFKTFDDVYKVLFSNKSKFTARQTEVIEALEKIAASEISPVKKAELIQKVNELSQLSFNAEVNNALLGKLEKLDNPVNTKEFENEVKATLEKIDNNFKKRLEAKAEAIKQEQDAKKRKKKKEEVENQANALDEDAKKSNKEKLEDIENDIADKAPTINETEDDTKSEFNPEDKLNSLSKYLKDYFTNYPDLIQRELENINSIYEANDNDTRFEDNEMILQEVVGDLYNLGPDSKIVQDLYNYYKERGSQKQATQKPSTIEVKQVEPVLNDENLQEKKADIERRREEDLKDIDVLNEGNVNGSTVLIWGVKSRPNDIREFNLADAQKEVNAKYDAELAKLGSIQSDINESIPKESQEGKGYNVKDNESKLITDTLEAREESVAIMKKNGITNAQLPDVYDKVVATLNDPESIPEGSKIFIDYPVNDYNKKATRPQLFAYVEDENGNRIDIGLIGGTQNDFTNSIYEQVKDKKGQSRIDLGLEVKRKAAGKFRNTNEFVSPLEIQNTPIFGIAQLTKQGMVLNTNGVEANVRYNNLEEGHTYLLMPTPQKDKDGNTIHYPAKMTTRRLGDVSQDKVDEVMDLLLKSEKNKDGSINNRADVNDIIFLNYDIRDNKFIDIYDYSQKEGKPKRKRQSYDITNDEDVAKLQEFVNQAVTKIDITRINKGKYNRRMSEEGRITTNLDPSLPMFNTQFIIGKSQVNEVAQPSEPLNTNSKNTSTTESVKSTKPSRTIPESKSNTNLTAEDFGAKLPTNKKETKTNKVDLHEKRNKLLREKRVKSIEKLKSIDNLLAYHYLLQKMGVNNPYGSDYTLITQELKIPFAEAEKLVQKRQSIVRPESLKLTDPSDTSTLDKQVEEALKELNTKYDAELKELENQPKARIKDNHVKGNNETELDYVKRMLPNQQITITSDIARIANLGSEAWGLFLNGVIYLDKNFSKGTAYHEAFHAVYNSYLSDEERQKMYTEAQKVYGTFTNKQKQELKRLYKDKNLSDSQLEDIWLEEQLAEEFRRYAEGLENKSISQKIKDFFKKLWNIITFTKNNLKYTNEIFEQISNGKVGKRVNNIRFNNTPMLKQRLEGLNSSESTFAKEAINNIFQAIVETTMESRGLTDIEAIAYLDPNGNLYETIYGILKNTYEKTEDPKTKELYRKILVNFKNEDDTYGNLVKLHKLYYKERNYIDLNDFKEVDRKNLEEDLTDEEIEENPSWLQPAIEKSGKLTLSKKIKKKIANLKKKVKINATDYDYVYSDFGFPVYTNFDSLYNTLEKDLSNIMDVDLLFDKLDEISNFFPELKDLIQEMNYDLDLKAGFFHHFAKGQNSYYTTKLEQQDSTIIGQIINNSRKNISSEILTNLESDLLASSLFNEEGKVNKDVAQNRKRLYDKTVESLVSRFNEDLSPSDFTSLSKLLNNFYHINISPESLFAIYETSESDFKNKFNNATTGVKKVASVLSDGKNPFIGTESKKALDNIVDIIDKSKLQYFQGSIMNGEGKMQYSHTVPNYIQKVIARFNTRGKEYINKIYRKDPSYNNSYILNEVEQGQKLNVIVGDNVQLQNDSKGTRFKNYNANHYDTAAINMYINQPKATKENPRAFYQMPITSDAPINYYLESNKMDVKEAIENLYDLFLFEKNRIKTNRNIKYYNTDKYEILPFFNNKLELKDGTKLNLNSSKAEDINNIKKFIQENMEVHFQDYIEILTSDGTIENVDGNLQSDFIDNRSLKFDKYKGLKSLLREYFYASTFMTAEMTTVFAGDIAFAKPDDNGNKITDMNKRLREISTPYAMLFTPNMDNKTYSLLMVEDDIRDLTNNAFYKAVEKQFPNSDRLKLLAKKVENTDGQSIITMERWRDIKKGKGEWNSKLQQAFDNIKQGNASYSDTELFLEPVKGFHFGLFNDTSGKVVPFQKKDSEIVLLPFMTENNPKMQNLWDRMYAEGDYKDLTPVDIVSFDTTIKKGGSENMNTLEDLTIEEPITLEYADYGIQQPSPEKHLDKEINFGTQFRKLLLANLKGEYKLPGFKSKTTSTENIKVKEGISELFESNPELANAVYEALGYKTKSEIGISIGKDLLSIEENEIPKKEGESFSEMQVRVKQNVNIRKRIEIANKNNIKQGKLYSFSELESLLDSSIFDDDIYSDLRSILPQITFRFGSLNKVSKKINGYYDSTNNTINLEILHLPNSDFKRTLLHEIIHAATFINLGEDAILTDVQKTALNNLNNLIEELKKDRNFFGEYGLTNVNELLAELANKNFVNKLKKKIFSDNQSFFEKIISEIVKLLGLNTTAYDIVKESFDSLVKEYKSINQITPQQKQQAQQLYSQYLDTIFPDSKEDRILVHASHATNIEKFEKTPNKNFLGFAQLGKGVYLTDLNNLDYWRHELELENGEGKNYYVKVNLQNTVGVNNFLTKEKEESLSENIDAVYENRKPHEKENNWKPDQYAVRNPEQIHMLGSKQDIEGFKDFVNNNQNNISASQIKEIYETFIIGNLEESLENTLFEMGYDSKTDTINYEKLRETLIRELENGDYGPEFIEALEPNPDGTFKVDLWNPMHSHRIESLLNSMIKNKVTRQKIKGATYVNASNYVIKNDNSLEVVMGEDAEGNSYIESFEVILPAWSEDIMQMYMNEDGSIKDTMPQELRFLVGYRIPTEGKYSMTKVYVKFFNPQASQSVIYAPTEIISQTGLDFDIDKMFFMIPEHKTKYTKSTWKRAYDFIQENNIGKEEIINEFLAIDNMNTINNFGYNLKKFLNMNVAELKELFIEDILFNDKLKTKYSQQYRNQLKEVESIEYIYPNYENLKENNRRQRNNGIIEVAKSILSAPQTFNEQSSPGSFENLKEHRKEILELKGKTKQPIMFALPQTQKELFQKNQDASVLIGVFANNVASNAMLQYESLALPDGKQFAFVGNNINVLDNPSIELSKSLSSLVAAAVDAVKDPVFFDLNIDKFTGDILASMIRMGVDEQTALYTLNNPVIIELANRVKKLRFASPQEIKNVFNDLFENQSEADIESLTKDELKANIKNNNPKTNYKVLSYFEKFYNISQDVRTLTLGTKLDASPPGPLMANVEVTERQIDKIKEGLVHFPNSSKIFSNNSNYPLINAFYENTYKQPTDKVMSKVLPWLERSFKNAKTNIEAHIGGNLTASLINNINNSFMSYLYSQPDNLLITPEKRQYLRTQFYNDLVKFRNQLPNKDAYLILEMLDFDSKDKIIKFRNTTNLTSDKITALKDSWNDLYLDLQTEEEYKDLATDLFMYNFMINGFVFNDKSFTHLAPEVIFTEFLNNEEVKNTIPVANVKPFVEQYIRNNFSELQLPQLSSNGKEVKQNNNMKVVNKELISFEITSEIGETVDDITVYPLYIKNSKNNKLFMRSGVDTNNRYVAIPTLGSKFEKEYRYGKEHLITTIEDNYLKTGIKNEKGGDYLMASSNIESYYGISEEDYIQEKEESQVENRETSETSEEVFDEWVDSNNEVQIMTVAEANNIKQDMINTIQSSDLSDELKEELVTLTNEAKDRADLGKIYKKYCK